MREARRAHSKDKDAPKRATGEADGQFLAESARSPGRKTSAGHMKLAYVLVFVSMTPELPYPRQALTRVSSAKIVPVVPDATTPPKLTPKDVKCLDKKTWYGIPISSRRWSSRT